MADIISLQEVSKIYGGTVPTRALDRVSVGIQKGRMTAIIGQSGSGKSTLLNLIGTLDYPTEGKIEIDGECTSCMSPAELASFRNLTIGFVFQFHHLLPEFTVYENIVLPVQLSGKRITKDIRARAQEIMELVGIAPVAEKLSTAVSGGQKQRTAIARALINYPKIVLADEPTGNLDSKTAGQVYELFDQINRKQGTTFTVITHDERIAAKASRRIELKDGKIVSS
jgi:lipoprotein-releasing system ATP-binding protein